MPLDTILNPSEFDLSKFTTGVIPKVDGSIELAPNNYIPEQFMRNLSPDWAPPGWNTVRGPELEGYIPYITREGGDRGTLQKQIPGGAPLSPEEDAFDFSKPIVSGGAPVTRDTPGRVIPAEALEAPEIELLPVSEVGFPVGHYGAAVSLVGRGGNHTFTTEEGPTVNVTTNGQLIQFNLLTGVERELVRGQGLWLTAPADSADAVDWSTLKLQRVVPNIGRTFTLPGPYKWHGRKFPQKNETAIDKPEPFRPRDYTFRGGYGKSCEPGQWVFYKVEVSRVGDSLSSNPTRMHDINANRGENHGFVFHVKKLSPEAVGYKIFAQNFADGVNPPLYQLIRAKSGDKARYFRKEDRPVFFGTIGDELVVDESGSEKEKGGDERHRHVLVQADPGTEDASGLENPTGEIDSPISVGLGYPELGAYLVGYSKKFAGEGVSETGGETPISPLVRVNTASTPSTPIISMKFPARINKIPNAMYGQLNQAGLPKGWTIRNASNGAVTSTSSDFKFERPGVFYLQVTGATNTSFTPNMLSKKFAIDKKRLETIAGYLEVTGWSGGTARLDVVQYDDQGNELSGQAKNVVTLRGNGLMWVEKTIAGDGVAGRDITFDDDAHYAAIRWSTQSTDANGVQSTDPRTMRVRWHSQIWAPFKGVPRRYEPRTSPMDHRMASNDPTRPYPAWHMLAVGPPPETVADAASGPTPVEITSFTGLSSTTPPTGWTRQITTATTSQSKADTTWGGVRTWEAKSDNTANSSSAGLSKTFSSMSGSAMGVLFRFTIDRGPTRRPSSVRVGTIRTSAGDPMAYLRLNRPDTSAVSFNLYLVTINANGKEVATLLRSGLKNGDRVEVDLVLGGGSSTAGTASTWIAKGRWDNPTLPTRSPGPGQNGINWTGRTPREARVMASNESHYETKWTFTYGEPVITKTGYAVITAANQPPLVPLVQPDVPLKAGTTLAGPSSGTLSHNIGAGTRENLAVAGTFVRSSSADGILMEILNTGATTAAARLHSTTAAKVELRNNAGTVLGQVNDVTGDTTTSWRYDMVVTGVGTGAGSINVYRTNVTLAGRRELVLSVSGQNMAASTAQFARVQASTGYTKTNLIATNLGEYEYDKTAPASVGADDTTVYQEYVAIYPGDVIEGHAKIGYDIEEFFVRPNVLRTAAIYVRADDIPTDARPFCLVEYDDDGIGTIIKSVYLDGTKDTLPGGNGWIEAWTTYTPTQNRVRWEHRGMTDGRYVAQKRLDVPGNLTTRALRDAARNEGYATAGEAEMTLNARVPAQSGTQFNGMWKEERQILRVSYDLPETGTAAVADDFRAAGSEAALPSSTYVTASGNVPDLEWVQIKVGLSGDGTVTPRVPAGGPYLYYKCFQPVLLREDRSMLPGGVYIGGDAGMNLKRPYRRSPVDTEAIGERATPRSIGSAVNRLHGFPIAFCTPEAWDELMSDDFHEKEWYIESPFFNLVMRVRFYAPLSEPVRMIEYPRLDEQFINLSQLVSLPHVMVAEIEDGAEVVESGPLV